MYSSYSFTTSAPAGDEWSRPGRALPPGKLPPVPIGQETGWPSERSWHRGWRKNLLPLPGIEPRSPGRPVRSQTLYWLSYPGSLNISVSITIFILSIWITRSLKETRNYKLQFRRAIALCETLNQFTSKLCVLLRNQKELPFWTVKETFGLLL
jgi:hypothetical protein